MPLLCYAFRLADKVEPAMITLLLQLGADPNQLWYGHSPWQRALTQMHQTVECCLSEERFYGILKTMLQYGASPYTTCTHKHNLWSSHRWGSTGIKSHGHFVDDVIIDALENSQERALELLRLWNERRARQRRISSGFKEGPGRNRKLIS